MAFEKIPLEDAARLIFPRLTVVVTSIDSSGKANAAPYSWVMPISFKPAMLALGIQAKETRTIKNIRETGEFVVHPVSMEWAEQAVECEAKGIEDKLGKAGLETAPSEKVKVPTIKCAKIALECKLSEILQPKGADHCIAVGEIVAARKGTGLKNSEIVMHLLGEKFICPGEEFSVKRKK